MFGTSTGGFIGGCCVLYFAGLIAAAGGVGGGGLIVPILLLIFQYELDTSIALSECMVVGSSFAQFIINVSKRHPNKLRRPLIYWELVLTLLPAQLGGANIGTILSVMVPTSFIYILALAVLLFASTLTLRKGLHKWHDENEKIAKELTNTTIGQFGEPHGNKDTTNPMITAKTGKSPTNRVSYTMEIEQQSTASSVSMSFDRIHESSVANFNPTKPYGDNKEEQTTRDSIVEFVRESISIYTDDSKLIFPTYFVVTISIMWLAVTGLSVGRTYVKHCSQIYLIFLGIIYIPIFITHGVSYLLNKFQQLNNEKKLPMEFQNFVTATSFSSPSFQLPTTRIPSSNTSQVVDKVEEDIDLNSNMIPLVCASYIIGIVCSMLGLGGGELFSPMILSYGVIPQVTSATTATMSLLNALTSMLRDITKGTIAVDTGAIIFCVGFLGGLTGRQLGLWVSAKYGRASVIVFFLSFGLYLSCLYYIYDLGFTKFNATVHGFC